MKKLILQIVFILIIISFFTPTKADFYVVGYFPNWTSTDPSTLPFEKLTHINYAFVTPNSDATIKGISSKSDSTYLRTLVTSAHAKNVKVLISIGGAGGSNSFVTVTANSTIQTQFVNNILKFVNVFNLDGVDMDWEFPTSLAQAESCYQLMKQVSDSLHKYNKLSTMAVNPFGQYADYIKSDIFPYVDFLNIMAYDGGTPHSTMGLANQALDYWINTRELPKEKTILGVPFYGRNSKGVVAYNVLVAQNELTPYMDQVDYTYKNNSTVYATNYNGIQTIKNKTTLALNNAGGIMIWELSNDTNDETSLLSAIRSLIPTTSLNPEVKTIDFTIFPNPSNEYISISIAEKFRNADTKISILDLTGKVIALTNTQNTLTNNVISTENLPIGLYIINVDNGEYSGQQKLMVTSK